MSVINWFYVRSKFVFGPTVGFAAIVYFSYHAFQSDNSFFELFRIEDSIVAAKTKLSFLRKQRETMEQRVRLLNSASLDPDMLEERARIMLNYGHPNDIIIIKPKKDWITE